MTNWNRGHKNYIRIEERRDSKILYRRFLNKAIGDMSDMSVVNEAKIAMENGVVAMHDVSEGGIFGALWDMAEAGKVGSTN